MYLKQLEIQGFKSFADRTRLSFEPGMIAIVGPNGCGKSNVSDAIRWVRGEQRPTAIRCSKLVDVVFNGTDTRKQLGLAEVSITFADCEKLLGTDYHEVTVTRRVYRDGSGEYFINKQACRLKDVHRLFMGTGIGTTSYSVMAQGQIDQILSSKPEDRRAVFEEAAGITKFKADRKEALRKIEQTEQNLQREEDILREMKRQIGSLQRQVGKAEKYRKLRDELRGLDIYVSRDKIKMYCDMLEINAKNRMDTEGEIEKCVNDVNAAESALQQLHADLHSIEERLATLASAAAGADNAYARAREMIAMNEQRILEYKAWSERDGREISATRQQIEEIKMQAESLTQKTALLEEGLETAREALEDANAAFRESSAKIDSMRQALQEERAQSVACDRHAAEVRDEIARLDEQVRAALLARERLTAEEVQLSNSVFDAEATLAAVLERLESARAVEADALAVNEAAEEARAQLAAELEDLRANFGAMQSEAAAKEAQLNLLNEAAAAGDSFAAGAQAVLDGNLQIEPGSVIGPLANMFDAPSDLRIALEASLRSWLDAVVVKDAASAKAVMAAVKAGDAGSIRLIASEFAADEKTCENVEVKGKSILSLISVSAGFENAAKRLLGNVYVVESLDEIGEGYENTGLIFVTKDGGVVRADGISEVWMPGSAAASPLSRRMLLNETEQALEELKRKIVNGRQTLETGAEKSAALAAQAKESAVKLAEARRTAAQAEGEHASVMRDATLVRERLEKVRTELQAMNNANAGDDAKREELERDLEETVARRDALMERSSLHQEELQRLEISHSEESRILTERRIATAQMENELQLTSRQQSDAARRRDDLLKMIEGREAGIRGYEDSIRNLKEDSAELMASLDDLKEKAVALHNQIEEEKEGRTSVQTRLYQAEGGVGAIRQTLDKARERKGKLEVAATELSFHRQNIYDHLNQEYSLDANAVMREPDPQWAGGVVPPIEELEKRVSQLNGEINALGPVNMVAIDEFRELEERYTREKAQEADLIAAKEQIRELINNLNAKSGELFRSTFEKADENFRKMFTKLFNGGEARLVLLENAEDPLECGIDIIARPPGKRPQSVTLLSGGERTMTAVALLFAIFMIKPAPFCMLDELDAALDDANIGRFVEALKEFLDRSQFLIITHNQHTIAGSDIVYGVSQQEKGVSRIISMKLADIGVKS
ncbi:MAG: chromosome segregation protein SMC [Kiritimatiellae bacterium]|nr:chromosome segregation protein SMC [Kiritimatiellia bacterium]